jgi:hypothetical protein
MSKLNLSMRLREHRNHHTTTTVQQADIYGHIPIVRSCYQAINSEEITAFGCNGYL